MAGIFFFFVMMVALGSLLDGYVKELNRRGPDGGKRHISRSECVALNAMAEEICECLNGTA